LLDRSRITGHTDVTLTAGDSFLADSHGIGLVTMTAEQGDIAITAGDDIYLAATSVVTTLDADYLAGERRNRITIAGDRGDADAAGTHIVIEGRIAGQTVVIEGNGDADAIELRHMVGLAGHTSIL